MVRNLVHNLCESLVTNIGNIADTGKRTHPTPITYLTQWKIVGNSQVHTLPYPDGVVLPTGYKRCKYLEFHGTEYLNTGIKTNNGIGMSLTFSTTTESKTIIGARVSAASNVFVFGMFTSDKFVTGYGGYAQQLNAPVNALDGQLHTFTLSNTQCTLDNINVSSVNFGTFSIPNANDIYIGTWSNNGTPDDRFYEGKIHSVRLYNSNALVFNGIPCLDDNNVPCLYDTVSGTSFYNDGRGTFGYELYPQPTEIWSCGEYNPIDGKWHILVQPLGGSIADIALDEPLRKVNDVADTIEFANGVTTVTRELGIIADLSQLTWTAQSTRGSEKRWLSNVQAQLAACANDTYADILCGKYQTRQANGIYERERGIAINANKIIQIYDPNYILSEDKTAFVASLDGVELIAKLATPTTELVDAPQIEEAESYTCEISQGAKAVEWSSFETN